LKLKGNFQFEVDKEIIKKFLNESSINEKIQITLKELNDEIEMLNN